VSFTLRRTTLLAFFNSIDTSMPDSTLLMLLGGGITIDDVDGTLADDAGSGGGGGGGGSNGVENKATSRTATSNQSRSCMCIEHVPLLAISFACRILPPCRPVFSTTNAVLMPC
jgi:hypothetical protein